MQKCGSAEVRKCGVQKCGSARAGRLDLSDFMVFLGGLVIGMYSLGSFNSFDSLFDCALLCNKGAIWGWWATFVTFRT